MDDFDLDGLDNSDDESDIESSNDAGEMSLYHRVKDLCGGSDLMQVFGPSGSGKSTFALEVLKSAVKGDDVKALVIDTERNVLELDDIQGVDYVYVPEWHDLYNYVVGYEGKLSSNSFGTNTTNHLTLQDGYDVVLMDSIGFPALVQYGEYRVADDGDQFKVFNELQVITGKLKQYSQRNDALTIVTNQPKSDLSGEQNPPPFGDKSIFGFKEVWITEKKSSSEMVTECKVRAFRSRRRGSGSTFFDLKINEEGAHINYKEQGDSSDWM